MPSDSKKKRDAKKKDAAKRKGQPKKAAEAAAENGVDQQNGHSETLNGSKYFF